MAIRHVVAWKFVGEATERRQTARDLAQQLNELFGKIPGLLAVSAGPNSVPLEGNWDLALVADLADEEALAAYQAHPDHQAVAKVIKAAAVGRVAVDFAF